MKAFLSICSSVIILTTSSLAGVKYNSYYQIQELTNKSLSEPQSLGILERFLVELNLIKNGLLNLIQGGETQILYPDQ